MRHLAQTRTPPPSGLWGEAEAEGSHDVGEVLRNLELQVQPCGENFLEESQNVRGTRLVERDLNHKQPLLGKTRIIFWRGTEA